MLSALWLSAPRSQLYAYYRESDTMPDDVVIRVENLSKQYRIGAREDYKTFRETLVDAAKAPLQRFSSAFGSETNQTNTTNKTVSSNETNLI